MAKKTKTYNVTITWTETIERTHDMEVKAKDEEEAEEKATKEITKLQNAATPDNPFKDELEWEETSDDDEFTYEVSEAE